MKEPSHSIKVLGVSKSFKLNKVDEPVLSNLSLEIASGAFLAICGKSGSGKTTLLRIIAGLELPDKGSILLDGAEPWESYPRVGYVVQDYSQSLLPWLRIRSNVALGLLKSGLSRRERLDKASEYLSLVGLSDAEAKYPWQLSGGMQQRVVLARALCVEPIVLCLDEPFASLDAQTRAELQDLVLKLAKEKSITTVLVTHDLDEAVYMADEVVILKKDGQKAERLVVSLPRPRTHTETRYLADFLDLRRKLEGHLLD
jgi:NitT/TauT family transport system ATP-binding protein